MALLGHPVAHSVSPQIHNAAFAAAGIDAVYVAMDVVPQRISQAVAAVEAMGLLGANITVPHKRAVFLAVPRRTDAAERSGAANTLYFDDGLMTADNTDVEGLWRVFTDLGLAADDNVVLFGAGGAARAAAVALGPIGARVEVVARSDEAARQIQSLAEEAGAAGAGEGEPRLVINATPLGLQGETLPERFMRLQEGQIALDLVYGRRDTPFLAAARAGGAAAHDGRGMLVAQAAASFRRWTGVEPPIQVMAAAAEKALRT